MTTKEKTVNITAKAHKVLRVHCAGIDMPLGDFTELAIAEKVRRDSHE